MKIFSVILIFLLIISCRPEKAYFPLFAKYLGVYTCNNTTLLIFRTIPSVRDNYLGFNDADTLTINGTKNEKVFAFKIDDKHDKDANFKDYEVNKPYLITGKKEMYRKYFSCINRKIFFYDNVLKAMAL